MEIYAIKLKNEITNNVFDNLMKYISDSKKIKIKKFINKKDQERSLIGELLLRYIICLKYQIKNKEICISIDEFGRPLLLNSKSYDFNISHSDEWIVCGVNDKCIGVDIEKILSLDYENIAKQFFTKEECDFIFKTTLNWQLENFYRLWTLKESYIKAIGKGLLIALDSFTINIDESKIFAISDDKQNRWYFKEYSIDTDYKTSICSLTNEFPNYIKVISLQDLIGYFK